MSQTREIRVQKILSNHTVSFSEEAIRGDGGRKLRVKDNILGVTGNNASHVYKIFPHIVKVLLMSKYVSFEVGINQINQPNSNRFAELFFSVVLKTLFPF